MSGATMPAPARPPRIPKDPPPTVVASPRVEALREALAGAGAADARAKVLAAFWAEVAAAGTPLAEPAPLAEPTTLVEPAPLVAPTTHGVPLDGAAGPASLPSDRTVTFLWQDRHGLAPTGTRTVVLLANKLTDPSVWDHSVLERLPGSDVWHRSYRMASDWRASYQLAPDDGPTPLAEADAPQHGPRSRWAGVASSAAPDPLNARRFPGKPGEPDASVVELDAAPAQPWRDRRPGVPRGTLRERLVPTSRLAEPRRVWTYVPADEHLAGVDDDLDLLVLLDGEDWAGRLDLVSTLDNLLADGLIRPTAAVLVDAIDTQARWRELTCSDLFTDFLIHDLMPWAKATLPVSGDPARTTLSGRSLGGITALYTGLRAPDAIGAVHAQSPSLWWPADADPGSHRTAGWLGRELASARRVPAQLHLEVGRQEWMLLQPTRDLHGAIAARTDVVPTLREYEGGHDAFCWRGGLADALVQLTAGRS